DGQRHEIRLGVSESQVGRRCKRPAPIDSGRVVLAEPMIHACRRRRRSGSMINMLRVISHIGVTDDLPERETRRIVFLNVLVLGLIPSFILTIFLTAAYLPSTWMPLIVVVGAIFPWLRPTLYWTHLRRYLIARIWFCGGAVVWTALIIVLLGTEPRFQLFL